MPDDGPISVLFGASLRSPPSNLLAEQALLGAILSNNKAMDRAAFLRPEDFADPVHGRIFQIVRSQIEGGHLVDSVTLTEHLRHSGVLDDIGGTAYVAQLTISTVGIINAAEYAGVVRDTAARRLLIEVGEQLVNGAFGADPLLDAAALAARAIADIDRAAGVFRRRSVSAWRRRCSRRWTHGAGAHAGRAWRPTHRLSGAGRATRRPRAWVGVHFWQAGPRWGNPVWDTRSRSTPGAEA